MARVGGEEGEGPIALREVSREAQSSQTIRRQVWREIDEDGMTSATVTHAQAGQREQGALGMGAVGQTGLRR